MEIFILKHFITFTFIEEAHDFSLSFFVNDDRFLPIVTLIISLNHIEEALTAVSLLLLTLVLLDALKEKQGPFALPAGDIFEGSHYFIHELV